jgi:hypothetical protein
LASTAANVLRPMIPRDGDCGCMECKGSGLRGGWRGDFFYETPMTRGRDARRLTFYVGKRSRRKRQTWKSREGWPVMCLLLVAGTFRRWTSSTTRSRLRRFHFSACRRTLLNVAMPSPVVGGPFSTSRCPRRLSADPSQRQDALADCRRTLLSVKMPSPAVGAPFSASRCPRRLSADPSQRQDRFFGCRRTLLSVELTFPAVGGPFSASGSLFRLSADPSQRRAHFSGCRPTLLGVRIGFLAVGGLFPASPPVEKSKNLLAQIHIFIYF